MTVITRLSGNDETESKPRQTVNGMTKHCSQMHAFGTLFQPQIIHRGKTKTDPYTEHGSCRRGKTLTESGRKQNIQCN